MREEVFKRAGARLHAARYQLVYQHAQTGQTLSQGNVVLPVGMTNKTSDVAIDLDVYWAEQAGAKRVALMKRYGGRFEQLHVEDLESGTDRMRRALRWVTA